MCHLISRLVKEASAHLSADETYRDGGALRILDVESPDEAFVPVSWIGHLGHRHMPECFGLAVEKAQRLREHPEHTTSRESRDEKKGRYGGAIRASNYILSFSGLPEAWDEAIVTYAALRTGLLTPDDVNTMTTAEIRICINHFDEAGL